MISSFIFHLMQCPDVLKIPELGSGEVGSIHMMDSTCLKSIKSLHLSEPQCPVQKTKVWGFSVPLPSW